MPTLNVQIFEGRTHEEKREFVKAVTEASCRTLGCTPESVDVIITELKKDHWATGGVFWSERS